jgi:hypothetical protein
MPTVEVNAYQSTVVGHMTNGNEIYVVYRMFADDTEEYQVELEVSDFCVRPVGAYATFDEAVAAAAQYQVIYV